MSAFRSHYFSRSTAQPTTDVQRKQSSRTPITEPTSNTESKSKTTQHVSKLAKRASRSITPSEKSGHGTRGTSARAPSSATAAHVPPAPRRSSVIPQSEVVGSARHDLPPTMPPPNIRTPSLVSGSSASTFDSPRSNMLRKKPSNIQGYATQSRKDTASVGLERATMHSRSENHRDTYDDAVLGISIPSTSKALQPEAGKGWHMTRNTTPPTAPVYAPSITPSTRYTDSPFSHAPTPSSTSSYSPAVVITSGVSDRNSTQSPVRSRPSVSRQMSDRRDEGKLSLPPVRESSTSSSNSTVKPTTSTRNVPRKEVPRKTPSAPPPTSTKNTTVTKSSSHTKQLPPGPTKQVAKAPVQIPPELAHLNVDPQPLQASLDKPLPPLRPSRDGTPSLSDMRQQPRIVQSDLPPLYTTYHKRTPSQDTPVSATSPGFRQRFGFSPKSSSRQPSPRIDSAISPPPSARNFTRKPTPEPPQPGMAKLQRTDSPAIGPGPSPSKSPRFGFFSRSKSRAESAKPIEKPKRQPTKGPVAGTGHEGYGRFGFRGRSGSTTSSAGFRSPSTDSNVSSVARPTASRKGSMGSSGETSELEEFLRERQRPVILRGSGSTFSNATTSVSDIQPVSAVTSSNSSSIDSYPKPQLLPSAMQADRGFSPVKRLPLGKRLPSDSSEDEAGDPHPTLAARRSMTKLSQGDAKAQIRVPAPINTNVPLKRQPVDSFDAETSAWPQTDSTLPGREQSLSISAVWSPPEEPGTVKPSRKWNFFQRAHASPRPKGKEKAVSSEQQVASPTRRTGHSPGTHYAMLEAVEPVDDLYEVEQILQENDTSAEDSTAEDQHTARIVPYESRHSSLLPSPPKMDFASKALDSTTRPAPPRITVRTDSSESPELLRAQMAVHQQLPRVVDIPSSPSKEQSTAHALHSQPPRSLQDQHTPEMSSGSFVTPDKSAENSPRQPRLSPVGRIPRVVSKRDRDRKLPDNSFSRPFARTQPHPSVKPPGALYTQIRELASPIESGSQPASSTSARSEGTSTGQKTSVSTQPTTVSTTGMSMEVPAANEFITFAPRKDSQVSYSSSSGNGSWMAAWTAPPVQLDDPWTEYNDLLDDMMPQKTPISAGSSFGAPFQYSSMLYDANGPSLPTPLLYTQPPPALELPQIPRSQTVPAVLSVPQQIARFMQPSMSPIISPHTLSELYDDYGNRSSAHLTPKRASLLQPTLESVPPPKRRSLPNTRNSGSSSRYSRASSHSRSASLPEANARHSQSSLTPSARMRRDTQLLDIAEDEADERSTNANLRFGALVTSRWLSFGRVLFSPAHNEMRLADEPRVLVLDGLGSDWSYYVAQTYPQASIFNLGTPLMGNSTSWPGMNQWPPRNHKQCHLTSISSVFPFPKGYFTAVVFRFPLATTDTAYQECIQECKRVLRPGGHLEVAALDLDLVNMGAKARSLVRGLKTRLQQHDASVSLRNSSDFLVQLIGRRGFEDVQRCVVGVPAAGRIPRSRDISSRNSNDSVARNGSNEYRSSSSDQELSFAKLLADSHDGGSEAGSKSNDEGITKMVAKVGRWWYSSCYEAPLLAKDKSIWSDPGLLRECEKQGTSFRLLLCHAQKPAQTRRRTVSV